MSLIQPLSLPSALRYRVLAKRTPFHAVSSSEISVLQQQMANIISRLEVLEQRAENAPHTQATLPDFVEERSMFMDEQSEEDRRIDKFISEFAEHSDQMKSSPQFDIASEPVFDFSIPEPVAAPPTPEPMAPSTPEPVAPSTPKLDADSSSFATFIVSE